MRSSVLILAVCGTAWLACATPPLAAQEISALGSQQTSSEGSRIGEGSAGAEHVPHRFWDWENGLLFAGVTGARALDYSSTLNMRRRGRNEALLTNWVVDDHPLFAGVEATGVGLSIAASYLFHRTGHHELERWMSVVHIGVATGGAIRNYSLKTVH